MTVYFGEVRAFAGDLPNGWLPCDGRLLDVETNVVLFSILGYAYGGNGTSTFALPDLRGRVLAGADASAGREPGKAGGLEGENEKLIPWTLVRWGIAQTGVYPQPPQQ
jgi:microcystin-dependent protein